MQVLAVTAFKRLLDVCSFPRCVPLLMEAAVRREQKSARHWSFHLLKHALLTLPPNVFCTAGFHKTVSRGMEDPAQCVRMEARAVYDALECGQQDKVRALLSNYRLRSNLEQLKVKKNRDDTSGGSGGGKGGSARKRNGHQRLSNTAATNGVKGKKKNLNPANSGSSALSSTAPPSLSNTRRISKRVSASSVFSTLTPEKDDDARDLSLDLQPPSFRIPVPAAVTAAAAPVVVPSANNVEDSVKALATIQIQSVLRGVHTRKSLGGTKLGKLVQKGKVVKEMKDRRKSCVGVLPLPPTPERADANSKDKAPFSSFPLREDEEEENYVPQQTDPKLKLVVPKKSRASASASRVPLDERSLESVYKSHKISVDEYMETLASEMDIISSYSGMDKDVKYLNAVKVCIQARRDIDQKLEDKVDRLLGDSRQPI